RRRTLVLTLALLVVVPIAGRPLARAQAAPPSSFAFANFVDAYLDRFAQYHPSIAAGNGIHVYDGRLEDFSSASIGAEVAWLRLTARQLDAFDDARLNADERVDHRILRGIIDGWLLDLDTVRTW